jgi:transcriptional regulator with XRE-family HTH domain
LSRYRIAKLLNVSESLLSRFLAGKGGLSLDTLDPLAGLLDLNVAAGKRRPRTER